MPKRTYRRTGAQASDFATLGAPSALETYFRLWPSPSPFPPPVDATRWDLGPPSRDLLPIEDRRHFYPGNAFTGWQAAKRLSGAKPRLAAIPVSRSPSKTRPGAFWPTPRVAFEAPRSVVICIRRKQRRQVFHALGLAGRRLGYRRARRGPYSSVGC